jgi:TrkA-N domain
MNNQIDQLKGHVVVCGFGRLGTALAKTLSASSAGFVVLEYNEARAEEAREQGYLCIHGDATTATPEPERADTAWHLRQRSEATGRGIGRRKAISLPKIWMRPLAPAAFGRQYQGAHAVRAVGLQENRRALCCDLLRVPRLHRPASCGSKPIPAPGIAGSIRRRGAPGARRTSPTDAF